MRMRVALVVRMVMIMPRRPVLVPLACLMAVPMPGDAPREEAKPGEDKHDPDDMSLLRVDLVLELKSHPSHEGGHEEGGQDMPGGSQRTHPRHPRDTPALRARHHGERHPMIWQQGVQHGDDSRSQEH
jgi:hypothetical protein